MLSRKICFPSISSSKRSCTTAQFNISNTFSCFFPNNISMVSGLHIFKYFDLGKLIPVGCGTRSYPTANLFLIWIPNKRYENKWTIFCLAIFVFSARGNIANIYLIAIVYVSQFLTMQAPVLSKTSLFKSYPFNTLSSHYIVFWIIPFMFLESRNQVNRHNV